MACKEEEKIHISIFGDCTVRDIFGFCDSENRFIVDKYVQEVSPISLMGHSPLMKPFCLSDPDGDEWNALMDAQPHIKRCITFDLNKDINALFDKESDYFLLGLNNMKHELLRFKEPEDSWLTFRNPSYKKAYENLTQMGYLSPKQERVDIMSLPEDFIFSRLNAFFDILLKYYDESKIVLVCSPAVEWVVHKSETFIYLSELGRVEKHNQRSFLGTSLARSRLPNCHVIEFPKGVVRTENHKWRPYITHFVKDFYEYGYQAMKIISSNLDLEKEQRALKMLKEKYEGQLEKIYGKKLGHFFVKATLPRNAIMTFHGTAMGIERNGKKTKLIHANFPEHFIEGSVRQEKIILFSRRDGQFISDFSEDGTVTLSEKVSYFCISQNDDNTFSLIYNHRYLCARKNGTYAWRDTIGWHEKYIVESRIPGSGHCLDRMEFFDVFELFTFYDTKVYLDTKKTVLLHGREMNGTLSDLPVYAFRNRLGIALFVVSGGSIVYISGISNCGVIIISPFSHVFEVSEHANDAISIWQGNGYLCAGKRGFLEVNNFGGKSMNFFMKRVDFLWKNFLDNKNEEG